MAKFKVYCQPILSSPNGSIVGFEALTRWRSSKGLVMPNDFIPLADETGIILAINRQAEDAGTEETDTACY